MDFSSSLFLFVLSIFAREIVQSVQSGKTFFLLTTRDTRYVNSCPHFYPIKLDVCSTESVTGVILHRLAGFLCVLIRENRISEIRHAVIVNLALLLILKFRLFVCYAEEEEDECSLLVGNFLASELYWKVNFA